MSSTRYRLVRAHRESAPELDESQQAVVDFAGGPLLVLAGPGTGKTTTLVEAVVERIERRGLQPDQVLLLTFSRKAAEELRDRVTARLGRTTATPLSSTFHAFCFALLRRYESTDDLSPPLRVLSAAEQDVALRELLSGSRDSSRVQWPPSLRAALRTRGLAEEVRLVLARARQLGLEPADVVRAGTEAGRAEWAAVGAFFEEYLDVLDAEGVLDYGELIHRAAVLAERPDVRTDLRGQFAAVFVDEYQDSDRGQVRLLQAIAGGGRDLVAVGDPDQSIYAFRGADPRGMLRFPDEFPTSAGAPAPVAGLRVTRRFGSELLAASRRVAAGLGVPGVLTATDFAAFRDLRSEGCPYGPGVVQAWTAPSEGAQSAHIADVLRRARLEHGIEWSEMAVLVRNGVTTLPALRRGLQSVGIPVEVASDESPLGQQPAVRVLLLALRLSADPRLLTPEVAAELLSSPLGGLDAADVRRLAKDLRRAERDAIGAEPEEPLRSSGELVASALADPRVLARQRGYSARRAHRLAQLLARGRAQVADGATAEDVLWTLWSGSGWPWRLRAASNRRGQAPSAAAADLDAVCALFETASRAEQRSGHSGVRNFLEQVSGQLVPANGLAEHRSRPDAVRLLTAHRAKGLEWRLVVVAGVQEGSWPDLRRRGTLLDADRLSADGLACPASSAALLAEERRLFYAAVTRARERLVVTAVASPQPDGDQPSRFVYELGVPVDAMTRRPARPLTLPALVTELRRVCTDPAGSPALRSAAAYRLAALAGERDETGVALAPHADPKTWWGLRQTTMAPEPIRPAAAPVQLSGSAVAGLIGCPLRWFLASEAAGETPSTSAAGLGSIVHALADEAGRGESPPEAAAMDRKAARVWAGLRFEAPWIAERERLELRAALDRFVAWHGSRPGRRLLGTEVAFRVEVPVDSDRAVLTGAMDRVELDDDGGVIVVDLKTGKSLTPSTQLREHPQLGIYQLAVANGAVADYTGPGVGPTGAELVALRHDRSGLPTVQRQAALSAAADAEGRTRAELQLAQAVATVRAEHFPARPSPGCRTCDFVALCPAQHAPAPHLGGGHP